MKTLNIADHAGSDNSSSSGDESDPITEIRFVPENKASCEYDIGACSSGTSMSGLWIRNATHIKN